LIAWNWNCKNQAKDILFKWLKKILLTVDIVVEFADAEADFFHCPNGYFALLL
jgi:hypothetical protein